ncbi:MAG: hypothetical protein RXR52_38255 [Paraburkholderia sp.]|uniref:hypothetical protein n=1 Tax=Paraburkholderia sp. TaxID=1926495 RepID=UPI00397E2B42
MLAIIRRTYRLIVLFGLFAVSGAVFAQTSIQSIGTITGAASNGTDKSMTALQLIYGPIATNPLTGGDAAAGASSGGLIAQVFLVLNSCILAVGVIWAMYHFGSAMIATGPDGEFLGQRSHLRGSSFVWGWASPDWCRCSAGTAVRRSSCYGEQ